MSTMRVPGRAIAVQSWIIDMLRCILIVLLMMLFTPASASVWSRLDVLEKRVNAISKMGQRMDKLQTQNNRLNGEIEELKHQLEQLKEQQREMYLDIERRLGDRSGAAADSQISAEMDVAPENSAAEAQPPAESESVSLSAAESGPKLSEQDQYQHGYDLLMKKRDFQQAIDAFQLFLKHYPDGKYADNAQFWLGEAYYAKNELDDALKEFQNLVDNYAQSPKVPDAVYKVGYIYKSKGDIERARKVFEGLIEHYPNAPAARLAAMRLETL